MILVLTRGSQSVFLRHLEFFRSVMFLTNNRVKTIDPAFDGRIHLTIKYPAPSFESRLPIWKTFLQSRGALSVGDGHNVISDLIEADFNELADYQLNGRQIKNTARIAWMMAELEKRPVTIQDVTMVLDLKKAAL